MKRLVQIILVALLAFAAPTQAVKRYTCNFETQAARDRWVLNPVGNPATYSQLKNKWYIGAPGNNSKDGQNGLYVSGDDGQSAMYQKVACWVFAYDTITLDVPAATEPDYMLRFDYCVMANSASNFDGLYVFWVPDDESVICIPTSSGTIPTSPTHLEDYILQLQPTSMIDYLSGTITWRECAVKIPRSEIDGTRHKLVFAWTNGSLTPQSPAAMVDNILITNAAPCEAPTDLTVTANGTTVSLQWQGTATEYEVSAYSYDGNTWAGPKIVNATQTNFANLPIGQTDFIVRAKCDEDYFSLKTIVSKLVYYPDQLCVDYLDLDKAICYVASTPKSEHPSTETYNKFTVQKEDQGPESVNSLHTVHFDRTEYEPRTGYMAKTVPDGELASVRLGNWDDQEFAERIEFKFKVDTIKYPVFLLKYLPILEAPTHDDDENPRFMLDMLVDGVSIGRCGMADFNANDVRQNGQLTPEAVAQGWHVTPPDMIEGGYTDIFWKEWTTVGVNLRKPQYQNKELTVRLTTFDCVFNAHFGYAYFTLGCSDGKLKGMKCGAINPDFEAPDGFEYRWAYAYNERYRRKDGSLPEKYVLGRSQQFHAGMQDDSLYVVDCMFVQDSTCFFSLYASTLATNPVSKMKRPHVYMNCQDSIYRVTFDGSLSWVQEIDHVTGDTLVSEQYKIESYEWNIEGLPYGWSDEPVHTFDFPMEGGDYEVTLRTTCGTCDSVLHYHLHLDPLGATYHTQTYVLCDADRKGEGFHWKERSDTTYATYGIVDTVFLLNEKTKCDSVIYLELLEPSRVFEDTMLLPESLPFTYHDKTYDVGTKSLVDTVPDKDDCSKTWVLNLEIYESLIASMPSAEYILCEGDPTLSLIYDIARGRSLRYKYTFDNPAIPSIDFVHGQQPKGHYTIDIPLAATVEPNLYTGSLLLVDSMPEFNVTIPFTLSLRYNPDVITQRWNDVLAIRNDSTIKAVLGDNGYDYNFNAVQWYVGGQPIEGATDFNYYTGAGAQLKFSAEYSALLTRADGTQVFTCPFVPVPVPAAVTDMPSLVPPSASVHVQGKGTAFWYDVLGRRHLSENYNDSEITAPSAVGFYLLVLQGDNTRRTHHVLVR